MISISDESNFGVIPMYSVSEPSDSMTLENSLPISPGKQDVSSSIKVVYELK